MVFTMLGIIIDPFTSNKRGKLAGYSHATCLMADSTVLRIEALPYDFRVYYYSDLSSSSGPIHGIRLIDILTKAPAVKG